MGLFIANQRFLFLHVHCFVSKKPCHRRHLLYGCHHTCIPLFVSRISVYVYSTYLLHPNPLRLLLSLFSSVASQGLTMGSESSTYQTPISPQVSIRFDHLQFFCLACVSVCTSFQPDRSIISSPGPINLQLTVHLFRLLLLQCSAWNVILLRNSQNGSSRISKRRRDYFKVVFGILRIPHSASTRVVMEEGYFKVILYG